MLSETLLLTLLCLSLANGADVGCNLSYEMDAWGSCTQNGCCEFNGQITTPSLCDGTGETCCYRNDLCPRNGADFCFRTYGTWVSRYGYSTSPGDVDSGFAALKNLGITRVYFNVWADGNLYAQSGTAAANGVAMQDDRLSWAVTSARQHGLEIYAWFEYGMMAQYGTSPTNSFASSCDAKNWLLYNIGGGGEKIYTTSEGGNYVYTDANNAALRQFYADMTADIARNYDLDGVQYDDHFSMPNGFTSVASIPQSTRFAVMQNFQEQIRDAVRAASPGIQYSFSPSPIDFAKNNHNVDWTDYILDGVVDEIVGQYYRSTANDYQNTINQDLYRVQGYQTALLGGIRLSGSGADTPASEVNQMIQISYTEKMKGISFWFADDLITGSYVPPPLVYC